MTCRGLGRIKGKYENWKSTWELDQDRKKGLVSVGRPTNLGLKSKGVALGTS